MNLVAASEKIKSFTDLNAWRVGHELVLSIYRVTKLFPSNEQFGLTDQLRRAVISITSNIAEGFSRSSYREKVQFYHRSLGSLTEVQNQLLVARDVGYISHEEFTKLAGITMVISKLINGLIRSSKRHFA